MNSADLNDRQSSLAPPYWVMEKVDEAKAKGYGFCLLYVEPENHDKLCDEFGKYDLAGQNIRLCAAKSPDFVRQAQGAPDHMPVMLKWADPIVVVREAPAKKPKAAKKAKEPAAAAEKPKAKTAAKKTKSPKKTAATPAKKAA